MASGPFQDRTHRNRDRPPSARTARDILIRVLGMPDRAGQVDLASELLCGVPLPGCAGRQRRDPCAASYRAGSHMADNSHRHAGPPSP